MCMNAHLVCSVCQCMHTLRSLSDEMNCIIIIIIIIIIMTIVTDIFKLTTNGQ